MSQQWWWWRWEITIIINQTVVDPCPRRRTALLLGSPTQLSDGKIKLLPLPGHVTLARSLSTWKLGRTKLRGSGKDPYLFWWGQMLLPLSVSVPRPWSYSWHCPLLPLIFCPLLAAIPTGAWALWEKETISRSSFNTISPSYGSDIPKEFHAISHTDENQVLLKIKWGFFSNSQKLTYFLSFRG